MQEANVKRRSLLLTREQLIVLRAILRLAALRIGPGRLRDQLQGLRNLVVSAAQRTG